VVPQCLRGQVRLADGSCGHTPIVRIPGRLHEPRKPPRHEPKHERKREPKRERALKPNLHQGQNIRVNTFHPARTGGFGGGGFGGGGHRGR
jgi:hypothetical protein